MILNHGSEDEHHATYLRTRERFPNGMRIWTGAVSRNRYLMENLEYMEGNNYVKITIRDYDDQESHFVIDFIPPSANELMEVVA